MSRYKHPEDRASETVTFRLTIREREILENLARAENKSRTDLIRHLLVQRANELGIEDSPVEPRSQTRQKPERPKQTMPEEDVRTERKRVERVYREREPQGDSFGDLCEMFRRHFSHRAEGTRKELDDTIQFLGDSSDRAPLLPRNLPLDELTSECLRTVRNAMATMDLRVAKKNLHLTYLRMMLHWAVKQPSIDLNVNPALDLKPFTISEMPENWPVHRPG